MNESDPYAPTATLDASRSERPKRPVFVTVICILLWLGTLVALITLGSDSNSRIASWYPAYNASYVLLQAACAVGMWLMKRWGFIGFIVLLVANLAVHFALSQWSPMAIGISIVICYFLIRAMPSASTNTEQAAAPNGPYAF